jgi:DUF917 family protein
VREAQRRHEDPVAAVLSVEPGKVLYRGKVVDVERRATEGFLRGPHALRRHDEYRGAAMEINFQNEWIVAWLDGEPFAMSPDLICVLDSISGEAVGTETIRYGQRVTVIALPPPPVSSARRACSMSGRAPSAMTSSSRACLRERRAHLDDIESLAVGAWILGTGGGGNPYLPLLNMRAALQGGPSRRADGCRRPRRRRHGRHGASMGAPLVGQERLSDSRPLARAVRLMERHIGRPFAALMSVEIGGGNGVRPVDGGGAC